MITLEQIKKNEEIQELIISSQTQLDALRLYRTFF